MTIRLPASVEPVDRRIQRTRVALREALMALMVERGWDAIDVQALCERANVGRSTFYLHYSSKEDLLKSNFAGLREALVAQVASEATQPGQLAFLPGLLAHVHEASDVFRALVGRRSGHYVQDRFRELLIELVKQGSPSSASRGWQSGAQAHFLGGALFEILVWWLGSNRPQKPKDIEVLFNQWSRSALGTTAV